VLARVAQLVAVTLWIVAGIVTVAYWELSVFWLIPLLAPAIYYLFSLPQLEDSLPPIPPPVAAPYTRPKRRDSDGISLCEHLQPLEAAIRADGIPVEKSASKMVTFDALLHQNALQKRYKLPPFVTVVAGEPIDNHAPARNVIRCGQCGDTLEESGYGDRVWPS